MRSKLFVPGSRVGFFSKSLLSEADALSFDLEDSVVESRKVEARENVAKFLESPELCASRKVIIVRCNALESEHFVADIMAITQPSLHLLNLPKVQSTGDICAAVEILERAEIANGVTREVGILANIETPEGLLNVAEIAASHPRVVGLQLALNDLFGPLSVDRKNIHNVHSAMFLVRMAAGASGIFAYDGAYADINDVRGFSHEAEMAFQMGYLGKSCIHPNQVVPANNVFVYSEEEIDFSRRVMEAASKAKADGVGAFTVDGQMIDLPILRRAEAIVAASRSMT